MQAHTQLCAALNLPRQPSSIREEFAGSSNSRPRCAVAALALEVSLFKLKPQTVYNVYVTGQSTPVATFKTNPMGAASGTAIGPLREVLSTLSSQPASPSKIFVTEGGGAADPSKAVLTRAS